MGGFFMDCGGVFNKREEKFVEKRELTRVTSC